MLVSPAEPAPLKILGTVSSTPEEYGSDFLFYIQDIGAIGIQRKEFGDLINSVYDGRLGKELSQMKRLAQGMFIIEGEGQWANDGSLLGRHNFSLAQYRGILWRIQSTGYWVHFTSSMEETIESLSHYEKWMGKNSAEGKVSSLVKNKKVTSEWGVQGNKEWAVQTLCNFGLGVTLASRVYDELGLPLEWTVDEEEFTKVQGIGKNRAAKIYGSLNGNHRG